MLRKRNSESFLCYLSLNNCTFNLNLYVILCATIYLQYDVLPVIYNIWFGEQTFIKCSESVKFGG